MDKLTIHEKINYRSYFSSGKIRISKEPIDRCSSYFYPNPFVMPFWDQLVLGTGDKKRSFRYKF